MKYGNMENQKSYLNHTARGLVGFLTVREIPPAQLGETSMQQMMIIDAVDSIREDADEEVKVVYECYKLYMKELLASCVSSVSARQQ